MHPASRREDRSFQTARSGSQTFSPTTGKLSGQKGKKWVYSWMCFLTVKHIWVLYRNSGYFIYNLGLWIPMRLWSSSVLCLAFSVPARSLQHPTRCPQWLCPQDCALQMCRYLCAYWHWDIFACSHKFASEWQQLQSQQEKSQVNRIHAGVHCLDSGPHLMLCRCALRVLAGGWAQETHL